MKFIITDIEFDTDGDTDLAKKLQKEWIGQTFEANDRDEANARGADIISDQSGWCVLSLNFKRKEQMPKKTRPPLSRPVSDAKAGDTDRACVKASLGVHGLVNIGGYQIKEKDLYTRIIDKIPGAQFHKIIMAITADLKKENS